MKRTIFNLSKAIVMASALSFVCFFVLNWFVRAIFENSDDKNLLACCFNMIVYTICFYLVQTKKRKALYRSEDTFNIVGEIQSYIKTEGKYLIAIYGILAVLCELNYLVTPNSTGKLVVTLCSMAFPFLASIKIPGVRSLISLFIVCTMVFVLEVYHSYKIYKINTKTKE